MSDHPLTEEEFKYIYSKVPRLTVELLVLNAEKQIYLSRRAIEPCLGQWHLPGGTVRYGEPVIEAGKRIFKRELGAHIVNAVQIGVIEYPSHYENGLDSPVGLVLRIDEYHGELHVNNEASASGWFTTVPENMHADMDTWLIAHGYLAG